MKIKVLLLAFLCACQYGFTMFAAQGPQLAQPADDAFALFQQKGLALACLCHLRCAAKSPPIAANCVELIGKYLKEACKYRCPFEGCTMSTWDYVDYNDHIADHKPYACDYCDQRFISQRRLAMHKQSHRRSVRCFCCNALFASDRDLERHLPVHITGARTPYGRETAYVKCSFPQLRSGHMQFFVSRL